MSQFPLSLWASSYWSLISLAPSSWRSLKGTETDSGSSNHLFLQKCHIMHCVPCGLKECPVTNTKLTGPWIFSFIPESTFPHPCFSWLSDPVSNLHHLVTLHESWYVASNPFGIRNLNIHLRKGFRTKRNKRERVWKYKTQEKGKA